MSNRFIKLKAWIPVQNCHTVITCLDRLYFSSGLIQKTEEFVREIWKALFVLAAGVCSCSNLPSEETFTVSLQVGPPGSPFRASYRRGVLPEGPPFRRGPLGLGRHGRGVRVEVLSKVREAVLEVLCNEGFIQ